MSNIVNSRRSNALEIDDAFLARTPREIVFSASSAEILESARRLVSAKRGCEVSMARTEDRPSTVAGHPASTLPGLAPAPAAGGNMRSRRPVAHVSAPARTVRPGACPNSEGLRLSPREIQVLAHAARGLTNKEIGEALYLSAATIKTHLARIASRGPSGARTALVVGALRAGMVVAEAFGPESGELELTPAELSILRALGEGDTNQEISWKTHMSIDSIKGYVAGMLTRTGAKDRTHLVMWAHARGVLD